MDGGRCHAHRDGRRTHGRTAPSSSPARNMHRLGLLRWRRSADIPLSDAGGLNSDVTTLLEAANFSTAVVALAIWSFSVPVEIRRANICDGPAPCGPSQSGQQAVRPPHPSIQWRKRSTMHAPRKRLEALDRSSCSLFCLAVAEHYRTCGRSNANPCVSFDFSVDPKSSETFDAVIDAMTNKVEP